MTLIINAIPDIFAENMTLGEESVRIMNTHIGQAHIAGTGPKNKTCRTCSKWHSSSGDNQHHYAGDGTGDGDMRLQSSKCNHRILNKADRLVPHDAPSCLFYEQSKSPPSLTRERKRKAVKKHG